MNMFSTPDTHSSRVMYRPFGHWSSLDDGGGGIGCADYPCSFTNKDASGDAEMLLVKTTRPQTTLTCIKNNNSPSKSKWM